MGSWVHRIYGALGSQCLWGLGFLKFMGLWAQQCFGALGSYDLWGLGFLKFMGLWAHKISGVLPCLSFMSCCFRLDFSLDVSFLLCGRQFFGKIFNFFCKKSLNFCMFHLRGC